MASVPTVKIVRPECPNGYVIINEADFDSKKDTLYSDSKKSSSDKKKK